MSRKPPIPPALLDTGSGESFMLPFTPVFGAMSASQLLRAMAERHELLQRTEELPHEWDDAIQHSFEKLRQGLSPDRFLADPTLSKLLQKELAKTHGIRASEASINLRLLALRKASRQFFASTEKPARSRHLIELYGIGVEAAVRAVKFRYGASIDDILAFPEIGNDFEALAREVSPGASGIEYRLCALQIRKSRHLTGAYEQRARELDIRLVSRRWNDLGSPAEAQKANSPSKPGILELMTHDRSLYILRTQHLEKSVHTTFRPDHVARLLDNERFLRIDSRTVKLRSLEKKQLPVGTLKTWELKLMDVRNPLLNLPVSKAA